MNCILKNEKKYSLNKNEERAQKFTMWAVSFLVNSMYKEQTLSVIITRNQMVNNETCQPLVEKVRNQNKKSLCLYTGHTVVLVLIIELLCFLSGT